jgi:hypothetical protein
MDGPAKIDMSGWSDAKKAKYSEVTSKGGKWLSDSAYDASKPGNMGKPGNMAKPGMAAR